MVNFYVLQIKLKKITIDDVPKKWQEKVKKALINAMRSERFSVK